VTTAKRPSCGARDGREDAADLRLDQLRHIGTTGKSVGKSEMRKMGMSSGGDRQRVSRHIHIVVPAKAGTHRLRQGARRLSYRLRRPVVPAFAGTTTKFSPLITRWMSRTPAKPINPAPGNDEHR
jgi:hypothetical protein